MRRDPDGFKSVTRSAMLTMSTILALLKMSPDGYPFDDGRDLDGFSRLSRSGRTLPFQNPGPSSRGRPQSSSSRFNGPSISLIFVIRCLVSSLVSAATAGPRGCRRVRLSKNPSHSPVSLVRDDSCVIRILSFVDASPTGSVPPLIEH